MCFSATASFGAAAGLAVIGALSIAGARTRGGRMIAAIPLLFAAQQAVEGAVWSHLVTTPWGQSFTPLATMFLFFAVFVWPAYVPFAFRAAEADPRRRKLMLALGVAGLAVGGYLLAVVTFRPSGACIAADNLYYGIQVDGPLKPFLPFAYLAVVIAPMASSTVPRARWLALATAASFAVAAWLFRVGFASVWCFFAAVLSGVAAIVARAIRGHGAAHRGDGVVRSPACESS